MWFPSPGIFYQGLTIVPIFLWIFPYPKSENKILDSTIIQKNQDSLIIESQNKIINDIKAIRVEIDSLRNNASNTFI